MMKLLTLDGDSSFSADSRYRILSRMEFYGLYSDNIFIHDDLDALIDEAVIDVEEGRDVIVAIEKAEFTHAKGLLLGRLLLEETTSPEIAEAVSMQLLGEYSEEPVDLPAQCLMPKDGKVLLSNDGLYSGFGYTGIKGNNLFFLPLDYSRIDSVIDELVKIYYTPQEPEPIHTDYGETASYDEYDLTPSVQNLVYSLVQLDKRVAFSDGEAVARLKPYAELVDGFGAVAYFVRNDGMTTYDVDKAQLITVRRAKEAFAKTGADFGSAISDIVMSSGEGFELYTAFVAVCDGEDTVVKKITTDRVENMDLIFPKSVTLLLDMLCQRADILSKSNINGSSVPEDEGEDEGTRAPMNISMVIVAAIVGLIAITSAVFFTVSYLKDDETSAPGASAVINPLYSTTQPGLSDTTQAPPYSESTAGLPNITNSGADPTATQNPTLYDPNTTQPTSASATPVTPADPFATEPTVSPNTTQPTSAVSSTSGTYTFYVFGYGHGVGLSQTGANAYAKQGWNYAEILANYYYGTTLVIGDTYPKTITYAGSKYKIREYLASALVSEMDESYELEALKAQVIALYTYAKYYNFEVSATGNAYGKTPGDKAYQAVDAVLGYYLSYNGDTALTPFHATSAGKTTSYYNVWGGTELPYLAGGRPSYSDYNATDFQTTYSLSSEEFKSLVKSRCNIELMGDPSTWISVISHDACIDANTGYVYSVSVGGTMFTGYKFRSEVMGGTIRSHCFKVVYTPDAVQ